MTLDADPWALDLALTRIDGVVPRELGQHLEAAARAHADDRPPPPPPSSLLTVSTWRTARAASRLRADSPEARALAQRGRDLAAQAARAWIDQDPAVAALVRATPSWDGLTALAAARTAAAIRAGERGFLDLVHELDGSAAAAPQGDQDGVAALPPAPEGWRAAGLAEPTTPRVLAAWQALAAGLPPPRVWWSSSARPSRCYPCPAGPIVVLAASNGARAGTPGRWATVLHELGHAWAAMTSPGCDRTDDEAMAMWWSDRLADPALSTVLATPDPEALAALAMTRPRRRRALAAQLVGFEAALYAGARPGPPPALASRAPPWALWFEGGAQAAYHEAEVRAAAWAALRTPPRPATVNR
ncbi:MAG: hypothetical protein KA297_26145 [Kofleriaceae bacterium]|nr:hypothetical protein [Kofleriaceae bacterium]MBP6840154.1 hypothetical protein [Kofleriaceae bacterium]